MASIIILLLIPIVYFLILSSLSPKSILKDGVLNESDKSIFVLPFKDLSGSLENQYFADGVMEDIINHLFGISALRVISRTSAEHFRGSTLAAPEIAKELGVNFILEGSVQQYSGKVRITVQLIDARHDQHIWAEQYDKELSDIFTIQSSIAKQIAEELQAVLSSTEIDRISKIPTKNPEAYTLYLKGRFFWNKRTSEALKKSEDYFKLALAADPDYALAYAGLADACFIQSWYGWSARTAGYEKAKQYARCALEIDPKLAEAHATMGALLYWSDWKWGEAKKELIHSIELNPNDANAHQYYSEFLDIIGNNEEARLQINQALELDPFSPERTVLSAMYYYHECKFAQSLENCRKVEELAPDYRLINRGFFLNYLHMGDTLKALDVIRGTMKSDYQSVENARIVEEIYDESKIEGVLKWLIDLELKAPEPDFLTIARFQNLTGNRNEALLYLEKALKLRLPDLPRIHNDPDFKILNNEPRFKKIIKQIGLSQYLVKPVAEIHKSESKTP